MPNPCATSALRAFVAVWQLDVSQSEPAQLHQLHFSLQDQLDDRCVSRLMSHSSSVPLVLPLGQVARFVVLKCRRDDVLSRVACPVTGLLQEPEEGPEDRELAPSGAVAEGLAVKVSEEAFKVCALHLLDRQHLDVLEVVDQLLQVCEVLTSAPQREATSC